MSALRIHCSPNETGGPTAARADMGLSALAESLVAGAAVLENLRHLGLNGRLVLDRRHGGLGVLAELRQDRIELGLDLPQCRQGGSLFRALGVLGEQRARLLGRSRRKPSGRPEPARRRTAPAHAACPRACGTERPFPSSEPGVARPCCSGRWRQSLRRPQGRRRKVYASYVLPSWTRFDGVPTNRRRRAGISAHLAKLEHSTLEQIYVKSRR